MIFASSASFSLCFCIHLASSCAFCRCCSLSRACSLLCSSCSWLSLACCCAVSPDSSLDRDWKKEEASPASAPGLVLNRSTTSTAATKSSTKATPRQADALMPQKSTAKQSKAKQSKQTKQARVTKKTGRPLYGVGAICRGFVVKCPNRQVCLHHHCFFFFPLSFLFLCRQ